MLLHFQYCIPVAVCISHQFIIIVNFLNVAVLIKRLSQNCHGLLQVTKIRKMRFLSMILFFKNVQRAQCFLKILIKMTKTVDFCVTAIFYVSDIFSST